MNQPIRSFKQQCGQVAVIMAIVIVLLIMMIGLVVDLGYLYTRKTELQNAADAAALAGAKELDGTTSGINNAVNKSIDLANDNSVDFGGNPIEITEANIWFANTPDGSDTNSDGAADAPWLTPDQARTAPVGLAFVKIDTSGIGLSTVQTWFMRVAGPNFEQTSTYGRAVAGPYTIDVAPIGVCAINTNAAAEYGFLRGVAYNLRELNPISPGDLLWLHPSATTEANCIPQQANADFPLPFICQGKMAYRPIPGTVLSNTGASAGKSNAALNSRFGYNNNAPWKYDRSFCTPDTNIKQYSVDNGTPNSINPSVWMDPDPTVRNNATKSQGITLVNNKPVTGDFSDYGVLWTYARPTGKTVADWPDLYGGNAEDYPETSPYAQTSGNFFQAPLPSEGGANASPGRRVINIVLIDCDAYTGPGGACRVLPTLAIGKFFMQREANLPQNVDAEFAGIETDVGPPVIQLYR